MNTAPTSMVVMNPASETNWDLYAVCTVCDRRSLWWIYDASYKPRLVWPEVVPFRGLLPDQVADLVEEADRVRVASPSSYVVLMGRAMEALCESYGVKPGNKTLAQQIEALGKKLNLPDPFLQMARGIRKLRNFGAHYSDVHMDPRHVAVVSDLFHALMDYLYLAPARIQAFNDLADEVDKTVKRFGQWIVYKDGIGSYHGSGEDYPIDKECVKDIMWVPHMMSKRWVILTEFCDALYFAREYYGFDGFDRTELHSLQHPYWIAGRKDRDEILLAQGDLAEVEKMIAGDRGERSPTRTHDKPVDNANSPAQESAS